MDLKEWINNYVKEVTHSHEYEDMSQMGEDENDPQEIKIGEYQTKYFHVCPGASKLYSDTELFDDLSVDEDIAERSVRLQDALYFIEEHIQRDGYKPERDYVMVAKNIAKNIMKMANMMGLEKEHDYIQGHIDTIEKVVKEKGLEEEIMREQAISEMNEVSINEDENPCWDGYEMVGMKMKDGKEVPNCVPKNESVNEGVMSELDILAKEAKDLKSFVKTVFKEFDNLPKNKETLKWLEGIYKDSTNESVNEFNSSINKRRAGAELKQKLKGKRSDGMGKYTATIYGLDSNGKRVELKSLNDLNKYSKFEIDESVNEGKFDGIGDLVKSLHFEINPKTAEEKKIELGKRQGEVSKPKQKESGEYSLRLFRKKIKYGNGKDVGVFLPGSYDASVSKLGDGPHKKAVKKVKWTQKKYDQWLEDMASNGGAKNAFDMAQNAKNEPGLIDWVKKNFRGDKPLQRIQWDIEGFNESVNEGPMDRIFGGIPYTKKGKQSMATVWLPDDAKELIIKRAKKAGKVAKPNNGGGVTVFESVNEAYVVLHSPKKGVKPVATAAYADKKDAEKWAKDLGGITMIVKKKIKGIDESVNEAKEPEVITQLRKIVKNKQNDLIKDTKSGKKVRVDMNSANLMVQVYDALKQQSNKDKFVKSGIVMMGHMAYKLMKKENITEYDVETLEELNDFHQFMEEYKSDINEAEYQGRKVELGKIMQGDVKKFKVYVNNDKGNVVKVNFGQKGMTIKKDNPGARKSFRARMNCDSPGPRWKARYWSCRKW